MKLQEYRIDPLSFMYRKQLMYQLSGSSMALPNTHAELLIDGLAEHLQILERAG